MSAVPKQIPSHLRRTQSNSPPSRLYAGDNSLYEVQRHPTSYSVPRNMNDYPSMRSNNFGHRNHQEVNNVYEQTPADFLGPFSDPSAMWHNSSSSEYPIHIDTSAIQHHHSDMSAHYHPSSSYSTSPWPQVLPAQTSVSNQASSHYGPSHFSNEAHSYQYGNYPPLPSYQRMPSHPISPTGSNELMLSPSYSGSQLSPHMTPPHTPGSQTFTPSPTAEESPSSLLLFTPMQSPQENRNRQLYTHRQQMNFFRDALSLPFSTPVGPFVPQPMYKPHTNSDRRRYVEEVELEAPIYFLVDNPQEYGIPLSDALHSRVKRLVKRDETVFEGRGPSVSIRLEWPGYRQWSRQIPTKDFRSPPGPITRAKLAKNVAKCVQRFITERQNHPLEDDADARWRVGPGHEHVKLEDLILVSIHHVSMGSWQPHLRLRRPFSS